MTLPRLIITADDFGMSRQVNEAVEEAHRNGVLTSASLVVTGEAAEDAIARARRLPGLGVGLHLALVSATPVLGPKEIPALLASDGKELSSSPERVGAWIALSRSIRNQARAEIRAQLNLYRRTGLPLDHVDGHWHFHQHPSVAKALVDFAHEFGIRAIRVPYEPALASWRSSRTRLAWRLGLAVAHRPLASLMWRSFRRAGIASNDWFFGMADGGAISREVLLGYLRSLLPGVTEIGLHPASRVWQSSFSPPPKWRVTEELAALTDPDVKAACQKRCHLTTFAALTA